MLNSKFEKEIIDLEHRKLISEYNALLIALASATLGTSSLIYTLTKDITLSLLILFYAGFLINLLRESKSEELNKKVEQLRNL